MHTHLRTLRSGWRQNIHPCSKTLRPPAPLKATTPNAPLKHVHAEFFRLPNDLQVTTSWNPQEAYPGGDLDSDGLSREDFFFHQTQSIYFESFSVWLGIGWASEKRREQALLGQQSAALHNNIKPWVSATEMIRALCGSCWNFFERGLVNQRWRCEFRRFVATLSDGWC